MGVCVCVVQYRVEMYGGWAFIFDDEYEALAYALGITPSHYHCCQS